MNNRAKTWTYTLAAAVALPVILWTIVDPIAGHALAAKSGGQTMSITLPWVVAGGLVPAAAGLGLATLLRRLTKHSRTVWLIVSVLALLLSLGSPLGGTTTATVVTLMSMHLLVGAAVIPGGLKLATR